MKSHRHSGLILLVACLTATFIGCPQPKKPIDKPPKKANGESTDPDPVPKTPNNNHEAQPELPPPLTIPKVQLTEVLDATCLVKVGDKMPEGELPSEDGKTVPLKELYGERLTVVFFWNSDNEYSLNELKDLTASVVEPFGENGVHVVGIDVNDPPDVVAEQLKDLGVAFPILLDPNGEYFAKVATEKVTRTYLLSSAGTILWFDLEYSSTTRYLLNTAIKAALKG